MYTFAYLLLVAAFFCTALYTGALVIQIVSHNNSFLAWANRVNGIVTAALTIAVAIVLWAFTICDFSLEYVSHHADTTLPLFYRLTALWAGRSGSLLFWAWTVAISGAIFTQMPSYGVISQETKHWFWIFFLSIMAFFLLMLTVWSNPFVTLAAPPLNGAGLNPLLQHPGMIFHPPLLFLGYGGFTIPSCLALAQAMAGNLPNHQGRLSQEPLWAVLSHNFILLAWLLLTAGITLGAWWAYMELGWGGYWAWDSVENASLIPWLVASACLHTNIIERYTGKLSNYNVFLMALTTIAAFFATYLVRSGVIQSLHTFAGSTGGAPLLVFILFFLFIAGCIAFYAKGTPRAFKSLTNKEALLSFVAWLLLALGCIILIATMWPIIITNLRLLLPFLAETLPEQSQTLTAAFYNRVCLPLFALLAFLLLICPAKGWNKGWDSLWVPVTAISIAIVTALFAWSLGVVHPVALLAASTATGALASIILLFIVRPRLWRQQRTVGAHGVHIGLLLIILGVALSGPYQSQYSLMLHKEHTPVLAIAGFSAPTKLLRALLGSHIPLDNVYHVQLGGTSTGASSYQTNGVAHYTYTQADLQIFKNEEYIGTLRPQIRNYASNSEQSYREVATLFGLGDELYATLAQIDDKGEVHFQININPMVNWLWVGSILMVLFPFFGFKRLRPILQKKQNT